MTEPDNDGRDEALGYGTARRVRKGDASDGFDEAKAAVRDELGGAAEIYATREPLAVSACREIV